MRVCLADLSKPTIFRYSSAIWTHFSEIPTTSRRTSTFYNAVFQGNNLNCWKTIVIFGDGAVITRPFKGIIPLSGFSSAAGILSRLICRNLMAQPNREIHLYRHWNWRFLELEAPFAKNCFLFRFLEAHAVKAIRLIFGDQAGELPTNLLFEFTFGTQYIQVDYDGRLFD